MKTLAASAAVLAVLLIAAIPASAQRGSYDTKCGDQQTPTQGIPWNDLRVDNVSCGAARKLADKYVTGPYDDNYKGWVCDDKQLGPESVKVKCHRDKNGGQRLRFSWSA